MDNKRITVFTPTYNRGYILERAYESLINQTDKSFIWLIVDDGSTDDTETLVKKWIKEDKIKIKYYKQNNGGKQRAHNKAVELTNTELFICLDSDDYFTKDAIEVLISKWNEIENKNKISGIVALKGRDKNIPIGTWLPSNIKFSPLNKLYSEYDFKGDTALLFRTDILMQYPFWVAKDEKFMGEGYIYNQIDQKYKMYLLNEIIYICEYLEDGYTKNIRELIKDNPKSYMELNKQAAIYSTSLKERYIKTIKYMVGFILSEKSDPFDKFPYKCLAILAYFPALIYYFFVYKNL